MGQVRREYKISHEGQEYKVEAKLDVHKGIFAEDADGNRGEKREYRDIDDITILDETGKNVTEEVYPALERKIDQAITDDDMKGTEPDEDS